MKKVLSVVLAVLLLLSLCTACQESGTANTKSNVIAPPLEGLEWGMPLEEVLNVLKAAEPEVGYITGGGTYPTIALTPEQLDTLGAKGIGDLPFVQEDIHPVRLNFADEESGTPVLCTAFVRLDLSAAEDAQAALDTALTKLYGKPVKGKTYGTAGLTLKKEDCGGVPAEQLSILERNGYDAFYIYPMLNAGVPNGTEVELWYAAELYVDYLNGK